MNDNRKNRKHVLAKRIGGICRQYRVSKNIKVLEVSHETGYSTQLIYQFENGNTNNMIMLFDCYFNILDKENQVKLMNDVINATMW